MATTRSCLVASGAALVATALTGCAGSPPVSATVAAACHDPERVGPLVTLRSSGPLAAVVAPHSGGQLVSLTYDRGGQPVELLYRGMDFCDRPGWSGKAPLLWPATGRNFDPAMPGGLGWRVGDQSFPMRVHGFARDLPWRVVRQRNGRIAELELQLADQADTRRQYPFGFEMRVSYRIEGSRIQLIHVVRASRDNGSAMPFSIGNHITFRQSLSEQGALRLTTPAQARLLLNDAGKPTGRAGIRPYVMHPVDDFPEEQAIPLTGFPSQPWVQLDDPGGVRIRLSHEASRPLEGEGVMFNLWGSARAGFFSPEPWFGRQNSLADGTGLVRLTPGESFRWTLTIDVAAHPEAAGAVRQAGETGLFASNRKTDQAEGSISR